LWATSDIAARCSLRLLTILATVIIGGNNIVVAINYSIEEPLHFCYCNQHIPVAMDIAFYFLDHNLS